MRFATIFSTDTIRNGTRHSKLHHWRAIIRNFSLNTTAHGIPNIARSESKHNAIFWTLSFLVFSGITTYFVTQTIIIYFQYPTKTTVNVLSEWPQQYPALTICNTGSIRYDQFIEPFRNFLTLLNITNKTHSDISLFLNDYYINEFLRFKIDQNQSLDAFFFPLKSMLIKCIFNGRNCSSDRFTPFMSSPYGFCYTFNAKLNNITELLTTDEHGGLGKLELSFYVQSHQYIPNVKENIGMITTIHDNNQYPLINFAGIALATGFKHRMTYTKRTIEYLGSPYSNCQDIIPPMMKNFFDLYPNFDYVYSEYLCYELCLQHYIYKHCGCVDPTQWNSRFIYLSSTQTTIIAPLCNISDDCYIQASIVLVNSGDLTAEFCLDCVPQCSVHNFIVRQSMWRAPVDWLVHDIKIFVENSGIPLPIDWSVNWRSYIQSNYVAIELLQESILVEKFVQSPLVTPVDVLSSVGGQTGLWIGASFLSLMELVEMMYRLIRYQFHTTRKSIRKLTQRKIDRETF